MNRKFLVDDYNQPCDGCVNYKNGVCKSKEGCGKTHNFDYTCQVVNGTDYHYSLGFNNLSGHNLEKITCDLISKVSEDMTNIEKWLYLMSVREHITDLTDELMNK